MDADNLATAIHKIAKLRRNAECQREIVPDLVLGAVACPDSQNEDVSSQWLHSKLRAFHVQVTNDPRWERLVDEVVARGTAFIWPMRQLALVAWAIS
eukprot:1131108-Amphidinium_carterae.2